MKKFFILFVIMFAILFSGCSKTTAFDYFSMSPYYEKAVLQMQKMSLMQNEETKALVHAIYLNNIDPKMYKGGEYFYVALHIVKDNEDEKTRGLYNKEYSLRLKENKKSFSSALEIHNLESNNNLRLRMPIHNAWSQYYLLKFKTMNQKTLRLSFENDQFGKAQLVFAKEE
ncbi:hypothetical protein JHD50_08825 [Sulfurimonas sp. MAG313]|nr:hypothetical protein [Sulfurimonas sp. MAG313]MDF1881400.1 hypothetical protein [Sulfurimonas sp. MAG313]